MRNAVWHVTEERLCVMGGREVPVLSALTSSYYEIRSTYPSFGLTHPFRDTRLFYFPSQKTQISQPRWLS